MNHIQIHKVPTRNAFTWLSRAWELFKSQSGLWMVSSFFIVGLAMISSIFGQLGVIAYTLAAPFMLAGYYHMAFKADNGIDSQFNELFSVFSQPRSRRVLLQLGAISLLIKMLMVYQMSGAFEGLDQSEIEQANLVAVLLEESNLLTLLMIEMTVYHLIYIFAIPIAHFYHEQNVLMVLKTSVLACLYNPLPLVVFGILASILGFFTVFTMGLAMIIVLPTLMIASYLMFNDILRPQIEVKDDGNDNDNGNDDDSDYKIVV